MQATAQENRRSLITDSGCLQRLTTGLWHLWNLNTGVKQAIYVSATPSQYEIEKSGGSVTEQIIRPTGLVDPKLTVKPVSSQVDDLLEEIRKRAEKNERILVTTLTKRWQRT